MRVITLEGPGRNALGTTLMQHLIDELTAASSDPILLTGSGEAFSAGLNLKEVASLDTAGMARFLRLLEECMTTLYLHPGPTVVALNGHAIAGGCVLALCCDVRVATSNAAVKIGLNEVALGLRFPPRILSIVRARVPRAHETEILLGSALSTPADALRLGLVDELTNDPVDVARARLGILAGYPRAAYARAKRDIRGDAVSLASDATIDAWLSESVATWTSPELRERIAALLGKPRS